jgi:dipeptidase
MRDHYEGTNLNMSRGLWAGPFAYPYRLRPDSNTAREYFYDHNRPVSVQYTGYSFISQSRNFMPDEIGGVSWFGVDDTYSTVYLPVYCGALGVPEAFEGDVDLITDFSMDSAYWLFNLVSNFSSIRYSKMIIDIQKTQKKLENSFIEKAATIEREALQKIAENSDNLRPYLTEQSQKLSDMMMTEWYELFKFLVVKHKDGETRQESNRVYTTDKSGFPTTPKVYGYPADWAQAMIDKDNPPDLKNIYSDDELMALFATNNKNAALMLSLAAVAVLLALSTAILSYKFLRLSRQKRRD